MRLNHHSVRHCRRTHLCYAKSFSSQGFSFVEALTVVTIIAILGAIGASSWSALINTQYLISGQNEIFQTIRLAQNEATKQRIPYVASFREFNGVVQYSVHSARSSPGNWQNLNLNVRLDVTETTLSQSNGIYQVEFSQRGWVNGQLGRLTIVGASGGRTKRCVFVSTLLGVLRRSGNQSTPDAGGRYCY